MEQDQHPGAHDHSPSLGYRPHVDVFQDLLFGSYMFRDPNAATACPFVECGSVAGHSVVPFNPPSSGPNRIVLPGPTPLRLPGSPPPVVKR